MFSRSPPPQPLYNPAQNLNYDIMVKVQFDNITYSLGDHKLKFFVEIKSKGKLVDLFVNGKIKEKQIFLHDAKRKARIVIMEFLSDVLIRRLELKECGNERIP